MAIIENMNNTTWDVSIKIIRPITITIRTVMELGNNNLKPSHQVTAQKIDKKNQGEKDVAINSCGTPEFMAPEVSFHLFKAKNNLKGRRSWKICRKVASQKWLFEILRNMNMECGFLKVDKSFVNSGFGFYRLCWKFWCDGETSSNSHVILRRRKFRRNLSSVKAEKEKGRKSCVILSRGIIVT